MRAIKAQTRQAGLSLVEMMVAVVISTILLLGVLDLFSNTFRTDRTHTELARVQETGRVAMELISREVRRAGYQGCASAVIETVADGITFPDDAVQAASATSLTLNYARRDDAGTFPNQDCDGNTLASYQITFSNCGTNLCLDSNDSGGSQTLTSNTQISDLSYGVPDGNNLSWKAFSAMTADDWADVSKLQVSLEVSAANDGDFAARTFTSVIELRNRL